MEAHPDDADLQEIGARILGRCVEDRHGQTHTRARAPLQDPLPFTFCVLAMFATNKEVEATIGSVESLVGKLKNANNMGEMPLRLSD